MGFSEHAYKIAVFGSEVRLLIGEPSSTEVIDPQLAALKIEQFLQECQRRLSRFDPNSELCQLNLAQMEKVRVSPLLASTVEVALWAAKFSNGLVDSTLVTELINNGYEKSFINRKPASLTEAIASAPPREVAQPNPHSRWQQIKVNQAEGTVTRPVGVQIDSGGVGKGMAADIVAARLSDYQSFVVDMGGDVRIGGTNPPLREVQIEHPISGKTAYSFSITTGAVATSGIGNRIWQDTNGFNHHLLDPSTGRSAWTGLIQATAMATTTVKAETLSKIAFLMGPKNANELLQQGGGAVINENGELQQFGLDQITAEPGLKVEQR